MLLAELEIRHSRPIAPTRRVALGFSMLPVEPVPGWGPVLLGGLVAASVGELEPEFLPGVHDLLDDLESGIRIAQPRLRHRFQRDTVGLDSSRHSLIGEGENIWFELDYHALPEVTLLGALYAAANLPMKSRLSTFRVLRKATRWEAVLDDSFVAHILGDDAAFSRWRALPSDTRWALKLLGFGPNDEPERTDIQSRFRDAVWTAHPDRGGETQVAGQRMVEFTRARKILLG